ncbi:sigma-70 family RNA polymerase sigma factor [Streptomyces sp. NBC_01724]|uniref:sigma-70 family RNA polymerase sigma factor n=1 Tax=unclassified Streptomyces TaxID=2593676 RepID=UPI0028C3772F|nr:MULTISPECIES: sigma-70 family RNA polymerase sigma factor [unclassified Streptomyces]WNO65757.1 sigma-70 family RNA polymerase sigma factor [Streptomyces sp. AM2-3-1]WSC70294.1 sigma-70 family RNA polymerase sigma factor [Streptomyces sp. NBC_01760]WTI88184.1 sigma-70 family RNA polymerase sigma factor [Streptomyces sp. NBC_00724]
MSGDEQQEEPFDGVSTVGGGTEADGVPARQVPSQAGPERSGGDAAGGNVLPGPWPPAPVGSGPVEPDGGIGAEAAVPMQRAGGSGSGTAALGPSDAQLILQMRDGDDLAYEELFRRHSGSVRRYARSCCRDAHTADDLTAEVFARTLQAVRGGKGPEEAVRAYLMTAVRHIAAAWTKTSKREQLVDDFAVFAAQAAGFSEVSDADTLDLGADVLAMHEAEQSMAMKAFRSLPERWQAVLWHTTVEEESPSEIAPLFGLTANATAVLASRAREGLKQAYLQAHVSRSLTSGGDCARYADRLGAYARGGLRIRAERGLRKHLDECAKCRVAVGELAHVNAGIPALLPVAVIGWFAAGYALKTAGIVAGGAAGAAGAGAAAATGGSSSGSSAGGAAAAEGLGAPVKAGIAAAVAVAAAAALVWALAGDKSPKPEARPAAEPPVVAPAVPSPPPSRPTPTPEPPSAPTPPVTAPTPSPKPPTAASMPTPTPTPKPTPKPPVPAPPKPEPSATATPAPPPPAPPTVYQVSKLRYSVLGDHTKPEVATGESSWVWRRSGMSTGGTRYAHGVTVQSKSSVTIELNRPCSRYEAMVGVDDLTPGLGSVRFSVFNGAGARLWRSPVMNGNHPPVPVSLGIAGQQRIRLVVEPHTPFGGVALADWAQSGISCG